MWLSWCLKTGPKFFFVFLKTRGQMDIHHLLFTVQWRRTCKELAGHPIINPHTTATQLGVVFYAHGSMKMPISAVNQPKLFNGVKHSVKRVRKVGKPLK